MATDIRPYKERRTRGKGLRRTQKQWEETITRHIGKVVDNIKLSDLVDLLPMLGCGYMGLRAFRDPLWFINGMVGYKLATNTGGAGAILPNISRISGLALLGAIGVQNLYGWRDGEQSPLDEVVEETGELPPNIPPWVNQPSSKYRVVCFKIGDKYVPGADASEKGEFDTAEDANTWKDELEGNGYVCKLIEPAYKPPPPGAVGGGIWIE